ncbi:MAG: ABC transporter permease, partial [Planctomycetaceae bacterium]|nr:ABC transporter permease [Planctomycetaceae bacterium]
MFSRIRQLKALMTKEYLQVFRDPSSILIAFVLPMILLFVFGYGMSLDAKHVKTAVVLEDRSPAAQSLFQAFCATDYLDAVSYNSRREAEDALIKGRVRVVIVIPNDFSSGISS